MIQPLSDKAELVTVILEVRPLPGHPLFWTLDSAWLHLWLYADSEEGAIATAEQILGVLPYERVGERIEVLEPIDRHPKDPALARSFSKRKQLAEESGLSLMLLGVGIGGDESIGGS
jgi:hypothetical protein